MKLSENGSPDLGDMLVDTMMKKVAWIALAVVLAIVVIYGAFRIIEVISSTKNNEVTAEG